MKKQDLYQGKAIVQGTSEWHRQRLGKFSASRIGDLISKKAELTKTAISYINDLTAERLLAERITEDDNEFGLYLDRTNRTSYAMQWGKDMEEVARNKFADLMGWDIEQVGTYTHDEFPYFLVSPDGIVADLNIIVEFKCPQKNNFIAYALAMRQGKTLKEIDAGYYWQVQAQLVCTGADKCAFVVYNPDYKPYIAWMMVERNEDDIKLMLERLTAAEALVQANVQLLTSDF